MLTRNGCNTTRAQNNIRPRVLEPRTSFGAQNNSRAVDVGGWMQVQRMLTRNGCNTTPSLGAQNNSRAVGGEFGDDFWMAALADCSLVTALGRIEGLFDCLRLGLDPFRLTGAE